MSDDAATATPFEWMGGEGAVRALVDRFYDLMDLEPAFAELRAMHGPSLEVPREKLFWFLCTWLGGPEHYMQRLGPPRLRAWHLPFRIGIKERDQWLACMGQAMVVCELDPALQSRLAESFANAADWMRNV